MPAQFKFSAFIKLHCCHQIKERGFVRKVSDITKSLGLFQNFSQHVAKTMNPSLEIRRLTFEPCVPQVLSPPALDVLDPVDHDGAAEDVRKAEDVELKEKKGKTKCQKGTDKTSLQP